MILLYTDGACSHNPGPGGWAFAVVTEGVIQHQSSGYAPATTNNKMELQAIFEGLSHLQQKYKENVSITVCTDSAYCLNALQTWVHNWKKKQWRKSDNKPIENKELIQNLYHLVYEGNFTISFRKIKAHQPKGSKYYDYFNDVVDTLAAQESKQN